MSTKFHEIWAKAFDSDGNCHVITVVGKVEQGTEKETVELVNPKMYDPKGREVLDASISYKEKRLFRTLSIAASICHPQDKFDKKIGIKIAKRRIKNGDIIGSLKTNDLSMLTADAVQAELLVKLNHIAKNIDKYIK